MVHGHLGGSGPSGQIPNHDSTEPGRWALQVCPSWFHGSVFSGTSREQAYCTAWPLQVDFYSTHGLDSPGAI